jgi:hypothetical protein
LILELPLIFALSCVLPSPSSQPADRAQLVSWVAQLADKDPGTRQSARWSLMGIGHARLDVLRDVVSDGRPLAPAQAAALHEIVMHVYLTGRPYARDDDPTRGFMGVRLRGGFADEEDAADSVAGGAVVSERIPGFGAFRALSDGDVIVAIGDENGRVTGTRRLIELISGFRAGETVQFKVSRAGRIVDVPLTLDPRPANVERRAAAGPNVRNFNDVWADEVLGAQRYWDQHFAPLMGPVTS